ncbi:hypothetical protein GCM10009868_26240 [Terrabacter aerolatus]|uniref:DUF4389 domain-containing protein n=1 Tax=Terrabacter aerolatus TaxID=422442 RepID=A0A512D564_9MICO|nr:DUF4389 domain-containing protein [Terrabacter aerolatus]GEO31615.1 hypothetical protein TAE01_34250 [Terrabacter aerolatus]
MTTTGVPSSDLDTTGRSHPAGRHLVALVIGCLLILPGVGLLLGGAGLAITYAVARDGAGYLILTMPVLSSSSPALTAEDAVVATSSDVPSWVLDRLEFDIRMTARPLASGKTVFLGVAPASSLTAYLGGVAHDQVVGITDPRTGGERTAVLRATPGADRAPAPTSQTFWTAAATGPGQQQLTWRVSGGQWGAVIMNADGSSGIAVASSIGVRAGFLLPLAFLMLGVGIVVAGAAVALIIIGASGTRRPAGGPGAGSATGTGGTPVVAVPPDRVVGDAPVAAAPSLWHPHPRAVSPVALDARLDEPLSRWLWLVKWFLAIPHFVVLGFLWLAFSVVSLVAFFAILFTGRYPRGLFDFNVGVLQWSWRVSYYCSSGGLGTDRYPPFSLGPEPDYPARLDVAYPQRLSRGLVLVKWWLLAIPHYLIVGLLVGGGTWAWNRTSQGNPRLDVMGGGILGLLVLVAGLSLLFAGHYPRALFDLVIGLNRWVYRVIAYAALMTDVYPPFQLDEGGSEVLPGPPPPPPPVPADRVEPVAQRPEQPVGQPGERSGEQPRQLSG